MMLGKDLKPLWNYTLQTDPNAKEVKLLEGKVVIDDINRSLGKYMSDAVVPEVYLKLGERTAKLPAGE